MRRAEEYDGTTFKGEGGEKAKCISIANEMLGKEGKGYRGKQGDCNTLRHREGSAKRTKDLRGHKGTDKARKKESERKGQWARSGKWDRTVRKGDWTRKSTWKPICKKREGDECKGEG